MFFPYCLEEQDTEKSILKIGVVDYNSVVTSSDFLSPKL